MKIWQILTISVLAGVSLPALAQIAAKAQTRAEAEAKVRARFGALDADRDGFVTRDEIHARVEKMESAHKGLAKVGADRFDEIDTDHDGSISRAEFAAHHDAENHMVVIRTEMSGTPGPAAKPDKPMRVMMMSGDGPGGGMMMKAMDDNGRISIDAMVKATLERFDKADANHDGVLTPEERKAARAARPAVNSG